MNMTTDKTKAESIKSLTSTICKMERALSRMRNSGKSTSLIEKRLFAVKICLNSLQSIWYGVPFSSTCKEISSARQAAASLLLSVEKANMKLAAGSPQKTLSERRITALKLAIESLDCLNQKAPAK